MLGLKSESCLRAHDECGSRFERQSSRPKCPQTWRGHRLISQSSAQVIHNQPTLSLCKHAYIAQKNLNCAKNISANLTHLSVSLLNSNNNETQPQAPQKREIMQAHKTTKYLMTEPTNAVAASELLLAEHLTLLRLYPPEEVVNASVPIARRGRRSRRRRRRRRSTRGGSSSSNHPLHPITRATNETVPFSPQIPPPPLFLLLLSRTTHQHHVSPPSENTAPTHLTHCPFFFCTSVCILLPLLLLLPPL
jgi:hypothetical protein